MNSSVANRSSCNVIALFILLSCGFALTYGPHLRIVRLHGTVEGNQHSIIEDSPTASLLQTPGARADATTWCDEYGHVWLFGGEGYDDDKSAAKPELLNDLWLFNTSRLEWNVMYSRTTHSTNDSKSLRESRFCQNSTRSAPEPRKTAASCGVPGLVFVVFGGINSRGSSLSDTWVYIIHKARWLPLSRNVTKSVHPPAGWSTESSWCHLDSFFVIGRSTNNVVKMWKLSLRTLEWTDESLYLIKQQPCTYDTLPLIQPAVNSISTVWNGTFYSYHWQTVHVDSNSQMLSVDLQRWQLLPHINLMNEWHQTPFLWSDLNSFDKDNVICSDPSVFQHSSDDIHDNDQSCNLQKCYKIATSTSLPEQRLHTSSWFYEGNMYIFGGQSVVNNSVEFFNHLCILQLLDSENIASYSLYVLLLSLISALVACILFVFGVFCLLRYHDYRRGRNKSRQLQVRYTLLRDRTLYE